MNDVLLIDVDLSTASVADKEKNVFVLPKQGNVHAWTVPTNTLRGQVMSSNAPARHHARK